MNYTNNKRIDPLSYLTSDDYEKIKTAIINEKEDPNYTYDEHKRVNIDIYHKELIQQIAKNECLLDTLQDLNAIILCRSALNNNYESLKVVTNTIKSKWL